MAFGIDDAIFILLSAVASGTAAKASQPDQPNLPGAIGAGTSAGNLEGAFELPASQTKGVGEAVSPLDLSPQAQVTDQLAKVLAAQGPPPTVPLSPATPPVGAPGSTEAGPPRSRSNLPGDIWIFWRPNYGRSNVIGRSL